MKTIDAALCRTLLPPRPQEGHKGTFGRLLLCCGSPAMPGAAALCAGAALRCGVGLVELFSHPAVCRIVGARFPEPVYTPARTARRLSGRQAKASFAVFGPGAGQGASARARLKLLWESGAPLLVDADGINSLAAHRDRIRPRTGATILTPHPLEMARLLDTTAAEVQKDRESAALRAAGHFGAVTVLKGAGTIVASPGGDLYFSPVACSGLAKGGSGDVLSGVIGALAAQGIDALSAAVLGVWIHARAGELGVACLGERSLLPSDLPGFFPQVFREIAECDAN